MLSGWYHVARLEWSNDRFGGEPRQINDVCWPVINIWEMGIFLSNWTTVCRNQANLPKKVDQGNLLQLATDCELWLICPQDIKVCVTDLNPYPTDKPRTPPSFRPSWQTLPYFWRAVKRWAFKLPISIAWIEEILGEIPHQHFGNESNRVARNCCWECTSKPPSREPRDPILDVGAKHPPTRCSLIRDWTKLVVKLPWLNLFVHSVGIAKSHKIALFITPS